MTKRFEQWLTEVLPTELENEKKLEYLLDKYPSNYFHGKGYDKFVTDRLITALNIRTPAEIKTTLFLDLVHFLNGYTNLSCHSVDTVRQLFYQIINDLNSYFGWNFEISSLDYAKYLHLSTVEHNSEMLFSQYKAVVLKTL